MAQRFNKAKGNVSKEHGVSSNSRKDDTCIYRWVKFKKANNTECQNSKSSIFFSIDSHSLDSTISHEFGFEQVTAKPTANS